MSSLRAIVLITALPSGLLQAAELKVAVLVQDPAQVSMQGDLLPSSTPGAVFALLPIRTAYALIKADGTFQRIMHRHFQISLD